VRRDDMPEGDEKGEGENDSTASSGTVSSEYGGPRTKGKKILNDPHRTGQHGKKNGRN